MQVFRGYNHPAVAPACALTIGNFDGVHRGHQAMLALLKSEAQHRSLPACVLTFEPHPRDYFAAKAGHSDLAPTRIATLRDKLSELARCGIDQAIVLPFNEHVASMSAEAFISDMLVDGLGVRYVLVGDDFCFGAKRRGDYAMLDRSGAAMGFDVARMNSYQVHGLRVSSSAVREALQTGDMATAASLLGRPYCVSGHVIHGGKLGRQLGFRTMNLRFGRHLRPAAQGIFAVRVHGLAQPDAPGNPGVEGVASLGKRPTVDDSGRMLLEVHCFDWPASLGQEGAYGKLIRVELLHKIRDEARYDTLDALTAAIRQDVVDARAWLALNDSAAAGQASDHAAQRRQTTRDRI